MPGRNQPRSSHGRSAIARKVINTNSTNGMMYQGTCVAHDGTKITPCHNFGGMKKGGSHPSATGFMRSQPYKMTATAKNKNYLFNMRYFRKPSIESEKISQNKETNDYSTHRDDNIPSIPSIDCLHGSCSFNTELSGCIMTNNDVSLCCASGYIHNDNGTIGCSDASFVCGIGTDVSLCNRNVSACDFKPSPPGSKLTPEEAASNISVYLTKIAEANYISNISGYDNEPYGIDNSNVIQNFYDSVIILNTWININNQKSCNNSNFWSDDANCEKALWVGSAIPEGNYFSEFFSLFDSQNEDLNKIELAIILGNSWNESGGNEGFFNICTQVGAYPLTTCPMPPPASDEVNQLVGRGLLQISYDYNYLPITRILTALRSDLSNTSLDSFVNKLPTDPIYPQLCGVPNMPKCPHASPREDCCIQDNTTTDILCPHDRKNTIYSNPASVCDTKYKPLAILSSLIYYSVNSANAVKQCKYSFLIGSCSINQGGYAYPAGPSGLDPPPRVLLSVIKLTPRVTSRGMKGGGMVSLSH